MAFPTEASMGSIINPNWLVPPRRRPDLSHLPSFSNDALVFSGVISRGILQLTYTLPLGMFVGCAYNCMPR